MSTVRRFLNRPGRRARIWRPLYEAGYASFRAGVMLCTSPLFRVRRRGTPAAETPERLVFCPNHESYLDPAFVQMVVHRRIAFVMTNDFYKMRLGRWFFALVNAIPVSGGRLARTGLKRAIASVMCGQAVCIFPEGRLSRDGTRSPGQRGISILARRTNAWIVPVGIVGSRRAWAAEATCPTAARVTIAFGEPMRWEGPVGERPSRQREKDFATALMGRIEDVIATIHDQNGTTLDATPPTTTQ